MKLTVAFGILAQTLPAFSDQSVDLFPLGRRHGVPKFPSSVSAKNADDGTFPHHSGLSRGRLASIIKEKRGENLQLTNNIGLSSPRRCDPTSTDPDIGVLSCGKAGYCMHNKESPTGGVCAPLQKSSSTKFGSGNSAGAIRNGFSGVECDPASSADIGILACNDGHACIENDHSSLGGFCASIANKRNLATPTVAAAFCDPTSDFYMYYDCDCSSFDASIGTGIIPCTAVENYCLGLTYNGCRGTCISRTMEYTFQTFNLPSYSFCYTSTTPYAQKVCFTHFLDTQTCQVDLDGALCGSCTKSAYSEISFDCTNVGGGAGTKIVEALPVVGACYQPIENPTPCRLCPATGTAINPSFLQMQVNVTGYGTYDCASLADRAYYFRSISETLCPTIALATASRCCSEVCFLCNPYSYIPLANGGIILSTAIEGFDGTTCGDLATAAYQSMNLSESVCTAAAGNVQTCCSAITAPPVTSDPAAAPTNPPFLAAVPIANPTTVPTLMPSPITTTPPTTVAPVFTTNISATAPPSISISSTLPPFLSNSTTGSPGVSTTNVPISPTNASNTLPNPDESAAFFTGTRLLSLVCVAAIASSLF